MPSTEDLSLYSLCSTYSRSTYASLNLRQVEVENSFEHNHCNSLFSFLIEQSCCVCYRCIGVQALQAKERASLYRKGVVAIQQMETEEKADDA